MSSIQRLVYALLLVVAACAGAASTAAADSIVFLKGGDVWLTSPDGTRQYQVTFDGGWDSPSQADDGTIVAVHGSMVVRLDRSGRVLGTPVRAVGGETSALLSDKFKLFGPFDAEVSPDGRRVAYWGTAYNPNSTATDVYAEFRDVTVVMPVDRAEVGPDSWVTSVRTPSWIGSDHLLVAGSGLTNYSFETWEPGAGDDRLQWWFRYVHAIESDAELSPDGRRLVAVAQTNGAASAKDTLHFFSVAGPAWTAPPYPGTWLDDAPRPPAGEARCQGVRDSEVVNPTWSPRSDAVAFEDRDGIWTVAVPDIATSCDGMATTLLAPGGSHPDWGPADVDLAQRPAPPTSQPAAPPAAAGPACTTACGPTARRPVALTALRVPSRAARRRGVAVRLTLPGASDVTVVVCRRRNGRCTGRAARRTFHAGRGTTTVVVPVRRLRPGRYAVVVQPAGGVAATRAIRLT